MRFTVFALTALVGFVTAQVQIQTPPSLVECQPASVVFSGGIPPYTLRLLPGGQVGAPAIATLPPAQNSPVTYTCTLQRGTTVTFEIRDSSGMLGYSSPLTVQPGSDTSCIDYDAGSGATSAPTGSPAVSPSEAATSITASTSTTIVSATSSTQNLASTPVSSAPSSTSDAAASGAAMLNTQVGGRVVALLGLIAAAFGVVA